MMKFTYESGSLVPVKIGNASLGGEYTEFRINELSQFIVDNSKKTLTVQPIKERSKIPKSMKFKLWENQYNDTVLPGKYEIIHNDTLVRSFMYDDPGSSPIENMELTRILTSSNIDARCQYNNCTGALIVTYQPNVMSSYLLPRYAQEMTKLNKVISYTPVSFYERDQLKSQQYKIETDMVIDINRNGIPDLWMVYCKLSPRTIHIVEGFPMASKLLAQLKFGPSALSFHCGVSVFEDYYVMPLIHNMINVEVKGKDIILNLEHINQFALNAFDKMLYQIDSL